MILGTLPLPAAAQTASGTAPPAAPFQKVSDLVTLPDFLPGLGTLYVDPTNLPAGPFLGYDHDGKLSATIYMVPIEDLEGGTAFNDLAVGSGTVTSVDIYYNAGHPGVEKPHAHVVLYHDKDAKARLAE
ncbi:hypothetical protein H5394_16310 [Paracoccus sp. MC1862]|nr:hypothetical protein [Paracoccus sp. MC1854]MBB1499644.1 hypothetical protein [Paracoccus sp. MC1862]QQO46297.1 hypothetical protein JGR78_02945 [Paracoccus sp. MC1862]